MAEPIQLTDAEKAEYEQRAAPVPMNPIKDFSAQELADLSANDTGFDLVSEFRRNQDAWADLATVSKVAEAHNLIRQRGFQLGDVEAIKAAKKGDVIGAAAGVAKPAAHVAKGFLKQAWNYANAAAMPFIDIAGDITGQGPGFSEALAQEGQRRVAENIAGTEQAVTGLAELPGKAAGKIGRAVGLAKPLEQFTPEEKTADLWSAVGKGETAEDIARGHGGFLTPVGGEVVKELEQAGKPVRPEETAATAAGDPFSWYAFGRGFDAAGKLVPAPVARVLAKGEQVVGQVAATTAGKLVQAAGAVAEKGVAPVAKFAGRVTDFVPAGGFLAGHALKETGKLAKIVGAGARDFGKQVAGAPVTSSLAQLSADVLQTAPAAAAEVAKGAAFDLGLGLATSESPAESEDILGIGTAFGALGAGKRIGGRVLSGQLIAPREYGIKTPVASSGQFPVLDTMHRAAFSAAEPAQQARLNAVREFAKGAAPGADIFMGDPASIESALRQLGVTEASAKERANQSGFFTTDLVGKDGKPRRVVIVENVAAAPHEAFHVVQDVIGEPGNRQIDAQIREAYADRWDAEGTDYTQRLIGAKLGENTSWQEALLDASGWGQNEAKEKLFRDIGNSMRAESGAEPRPADVQAMAKQELGRLTDEALSRNPNITPEQAQSRVWRDILTPQEAGAVADRYIARELAAENFDALFKHTGGKKDTPQGVLPFLAEKVGQVVSALGGNPLEARTSEIGKLPLRPEAIQAVRGVTESRLPEIKLPTAPPRASAGSPEAVQADAQRARELADAAPETPLVAGGTKSARELLGQVAEAIATRTGVKINYLSAPDQPAAAISSNRETRRAMVETYRTMPPEARSLWEKSFFPERVIRTKGGEYQVQGFSPEVFAANAHRTAEALAKIGPEGRKLSPYEIDADTHTFTPDAWRSLYEDVQRFVRNQKSGRTGAGEQLVVPRELTEKGFFAPQIKPGGETKIPQRNADFINLLFGFKLPETPRIQKGKLPLAIAGAEVSTATKPGRVSVPVRPRGEFTGAEAERQGIAGRSVAEVNPVRAEIERAAQAAGVAAPSLIEAIQKLNLESIKEIESAPELPEFRGNTLTLTGGFQPRAWKVSGQKGGLKKEIEVKAEDIAGARRQAESQGMRVSNVAPVQSTALLGQFQPRSAKEIELMTPEEFRGWASKIPQGFTGAAHEMGRNIPTQTEARDLRAAYDRLTARSPKAMQEARALMQSGNQEGAIAKMDEAAALASQAQFFREAAEAAEGTGSAGLVLRREEGYVPPFPLETLTGQAQPPLWRDNILDSLESWQNKGTPEQLRAHLAKTRGTAEQADWIGLEDWLKGKSSVTKQEVQNFVKENSVYIEEVEKAKDILDLRFNKEETDYAGGEDVYDVIDRKTGRVRFTGSKPESIEYVEEEGQLKNSATKFEAYQTPGGENYRELLLTLPSKPTQNRNSVMYDMFPGQMYEDLPKYQRTQVDDYVKQLGEESKTFESSHFEEPNILAHVRFNERKDTEGNPMLFVEEVQSDWHQEGRKKGYAGPTRESNPLKEKHLERLQQIAEQISDAKTDYVADVKPTDLAAVMERNIKLRILPAEETTPLAEEARRITTELNFISAAEARKAAEVPDAPFKNTWPMLVMRRMIRYAAENGFNKLGWVTGEQTAARYDLSKQVDGIYYNAETQQLTANKGSSQVLKKEGVAPENLADYVGKDAAEKLMSQTPTGRIRKLEKDDLKVGGGWALNLYDKQLPNEVNKFAKKFGVRVGESNISQEHDASFNQPFEGMTKALEIFDRGGEIYGVEQAHETLITERKDIPNYDVYVMGDKQPNILVHSLDITPEMKAEAMRGMSQFQPRAGKASAVNQRGLMLPPPIPDDKKRISVEPRKLK